jgi:hypothetical protein
MIRVDFYLNKWRHSRLFSSYRRLLWLYSQGGNIPKLARFTPAGIPQHVIQRRNNRLDFPGFARHLKELKCNSKRGDYEQRQAVSRRIQA